MKFIILASVNQSLLIFLKQIEKLLNKKGKSNMKKKKS